MEKGANVNSVDGNGDTALIWVACEGKTELVKALLDKGANIDAEIETAIRCCGGQSKATVPTW